LFQTKLRKNCCNESDHSLLNSPIAKDRIFIIAAAVRGSERSK